MYFRLFRTVLHTDEERTDDRKDNPQCRDDQWQQDGGHAAKVVVYTSTHVIDDIIAKYHGRQDCGDIRAKQISSHTGNVTYVIPYVVRDGGRVSRVIFRNARLNLADEVSTDVCSFGVNTSTNACKQSNGFSTQGEACERFKNLGHLHDACPLSSTNDLKQGNEQHAQAKNG